MTGPFIPAGSRGHPSSRQGAVVWVTRSSSGRAWSPASRFAQVLVTVISSSLEPRRSAPEISALKGASTLYHRKSRSGRPPPGCSPAPGPQKSPVDPQDWMSTQSFSGKRHFRNNSGSGHLPIPSSRVVPQIPPATAVRPTPGQRLPSTPFQGISRFKERPVLTPVPLCQRTLFSKITKNDSPASKRRGRMVLPLPCARIRRA